MPEYTIGRKIESPAEGLKEGHGSIQGGDPSEVGGRSKSGLVICPYCYCANWVTPGCDDYVCGHCGRRFAPS